ncbi:hypothetical protein [Actinomadura sp. NPDC049753]|uniref:hypothetical protein n=1 Tax=Actinomadura sp. NPDC049753 TaxID=3154739 RepID=UPI00343A9407
MTRKAWPAVLAAAALLPWAAPPAQAADGPALTVDPSASRHAITCGAFCGRACCTNAQCMQS